MRKPLSLGALALLFAVGASDVTYPRLDYDPAVFAGLHAAEPARPRVATINYPACRPGREDDRCIQLYERGVRAALAQWERPTGGYAGAVRVSTETLALPATATAVGGPVERRTDYPACSTDEDDDRCIQLYERGVRGLRTGTPGI